MSLEKSVNKTLLENKQKRDAAKQAESAPAVTTPQTSSQPIEITPVPVAKPAELQTTIEPPKPKESVTPQPVETKPETKAEVPVKKTTEPANETPDPTSVEEPAEEIKWDAHIPETTTADTPTAAESVNIKKIGSALKLDVTDEDQLVKVVSEKLSKLSTLEESVNGVPEVLKKTLEIAKLGGDWKTYAGISSIDTTKLDPETEYEKIYERYNAHRFVDPVTKQVDWEKFDAEFAMIPKGQKEIEGRKIIDQLAFEQNQRKTQIEMQAQAQREAFQQTLSEAANEISKLLPKEKIGIAFEPKHSSFLYEGIANGSLIKKHIGNIDISTLSKADAKKLVRTVALAEFGEGASQHQYKQGMSAGKKALMQSTQNVQINTPASAPIPEPLEEPAKETSAEITKRAMDKRRPKNSL